MSNSRRAASLHGRPLGDLRAPHLAVPASKLRPDAPRADSVVRSRLIEQIAKPDVPIVTVVAPGGYGKTSLLQQWARHDPRPFVWLRLDAHDNDPTALLTGLALAIDRAVPVDVATLRSLAAPSHAAIGTAMQLISHMDQAAPGGVLVLDDLHRLENVECRDIIGAFVEWPPDGWKVAMAGREELWLPIPRLRAERRVTELNASDLAMDDDEASELLHAAGAELDPTETSDLNRRAEGWPVALYLAALAITSGAERGPTFHWRGGNDRIMAEYLLSELLTRLSPDTTAFLIATSLPERLCGPLCDALLDSSASADRLASLAQRNALVTPLDDDPGWYRYHPLFREMLSAELRRREPERALALRRRAADWYEANGAPELAVDEAMEVGDVSWVARLAGEHAQSFYQSGRGTTIQRWFDWIDERNRLQRFPRVAVAGAMTHILAGRAAAAERWIDAAEHSLGPDGRPAATHPELDGELAMLRAASCRAGSERMRQDAAKAVRLVSPGGSWRPASLALLGIANLLAGEADQADRLLAEAVDVAEDMGASVTASMALAERALLAERGGRPADRDVLLGRSLRVIADHGLRDYATSALAFAIDGRVRLGHGDAVGAKASLSLAQRLRPHLNHSLPFYAVQARLELVRGYLRVTDVSGARTVLREAVEISRRIPDLGRLNGEITELQHWLDDLHMNILGASSLTSAELRLLPLLATNLSFRKIGERLFISPNTVKTEAISIYRKFGVSSRGEAIERAQALGLFGR